MSTVPPDWQTLNAYVDGELDVDAAAAVAAAAGEDPAVAEQIAALYRLKGTVRETRPAAPADLDGLMPRPPWWRSRAVRAAAAAVVLIAVVAGGWLSLRPHQASLPTDLLAIARELHVDWLHADSTAGQTNPRAAMTTLIGALTQFRELPIIPDLESAKLTVDHVGFSTQSGRQVLQIGYLGTHGCHLSLFVFPGAKLPTTAVRLDRGNELAYGWQVEQLGYLLFALGMDHNRFDLIARKVEEETRTHAPFDSLTREALAESKRKSAACAA